MDLIVIPQYFYPTYGGLQHFTRRLCEALATLDINVKIVAPEPEANREIVDQEWNNENIIITNIKGSRLNFWVSLKTEILKFPINSKILIIGLEPSNLIEYQLDFINLAFEINHQVYLRIATSNDFSDVIPQYPNRILIFNNIRKVIVMTEEMKGEINSCGKITTQILVIPNFIDFTLYSEKEQDVKIGLRKKYNLPNNKFIALWTGRLTSQKRILHLLNIWKSANIDGNLVIVGNDAYGDKKYMKRINHLIDSKEIKNVFFRGPFKEKDMPELYNCADCFLFTSLREGLSNSLLESSACGLPAIAYDIPCTKLVLNAINPHKHTIVKRHDIAGFINALRKAPTILIHNPKIDDNRYIFSKERVVQKYVETLNH